MKPSHIYAIIRKQLKDTFHNKLPCTVCDVSGNRSNF